MHAKARILVVDDHERMVEAIKRILQQAGYEVCTAFDGKTGLQAALEQKPDLIILDIVMPGTDGYQVCRRLASYPETARIPVLMLSGGKGRLDQGEQETKKGVREQITAYDAGAVEFLTKPVRAQELVDRVKVLLWASGVQS